MTEENLWEELLKFQRLQCTGERAKAGWYLDQDAIIEAMDILDIKIQVRIRYMSGKYRGGTHYTRKDHHKITVDQTLPFRIANLVLWHELAHAMQAERFVRETGKHIYLFDTAYKLARGEWGEAYEGNIYEIEANKIATENYHLHLLVKGT